MTVSGASRCPVVVAAAEVIDQAIARASYTDGKTDLRTLLSLIQHELDMRGSIHESQQRFAWAGNFRDAAAEIGRLLRVTA
jgi:pyruvate/oxaloacetate carboxyltransferase